MEGKAIDRRVKKTRQLLRNSFAELLLDNPIAEIRVREIVERADVSRGTFYLHFRDVFDMFEQVKRDITDEMRQLILDHVSDADETRLHSSVLDIFNYLADNSQLVRALLGRHGDAGFLRELSNTVKLNCLDEWLNRQGYADTDGSDLVHAYVVAGFVGLFESWLGGGMKKTPKEMAELTKTLIENGMSGLNVAKSTVTLLVRRSGVYG